MRSALSWDFTQERMAIPYRRFGTTYRSHLQGSSSPRRVRITDIPLKNILAPDTGKCAGYIPEQWNQSVMVCFYNYTFNCKTISRIFRIFSRQSNSTPMQLWDLIIYSACLKAYKFSSKVWHNSPTELDFSSFPHQVRLNVYPSYEKF